MEIATHPPAIADELVGALPPISQASHLTSLQGAVSPIRRLLNYQPSLARVCSDTFGQALNREFSGLGVGPGSIFVQEQPDGVPMRSLLAVMHDFLATGKVLDPAQILGFFTAPDALGVNRRLNTMTSAACIQVVLGYAQRLFGLYDQALTRFWRAPGPETGDLTHRDALLWWRNRQLLAEANLRRADNLLEPTQGISADGLALVRGVIGGDGPLGAAVSRPVLYRLIVVVGGRDFGLAGCFVLASTGGLSTVGPVLLYTPQQGLKEFASYSVLLNELSLCQVTHEREDILLNVPAADREQVLGALLGGRGHWSSREYVAQAQGSLLGQVLDEQLALQRVNLYAAFLPYRPGIEQRLPAVLALAGGLPADLQRRPLRPDTLPVVPPASSVGDQQKYLMRQLDTFNALTGNLLKALPVVDELSGSASAEFAIRVSEFWDSIQAGQGPQRQLLVRLRKQVLATLAALRSVDGTLAPASRALIDSVLKYPTQAARQIAFPVGACPRVYSLSMADGSRFAGVFALSPDGTNPPLGSVVLYTQMEGFEAFSSHEALRDAVILRLEDASQAGVLLADSLPHAVQARLLGMWEGRRRLVLNPIDDDFVLDSVRSLLAKQQLDLLSTLAGNEVLDKDALIRALDLSPQLDVADAFVARNRRLEAQLVPAWIRSLRAADRQQLQELERVAQEKNQLLAALLVGIPSLGGYARGKLIGKLQAFLADKRLWGVAVGDIDPDKIIVTLVENVRVRYSPAPGLVAPHESTHVERVSLTGLALKNIRPWDQTLSWQSKSSIGAILTYADGRRVIDNEGQPVALARDVLERWVTDMDVGHRYVEEVLKHNFDASVINGDAWYIRQAWLDAQAATLRYEVLWARLDPIAYRTPLAADPGSKRGAQWMSAVMAAQMPAVRPRVEGAAVVVSHLALGKPGVDPLKGGSQLVRGILVISIEDAPEMVLYVQDAPDDKAIREVLSEAHLRELLLLPHWQAYLKERLAVGDPAVINRVLTPRVGMLMRLVPCEVPVLPELYRLMVARLKLHAAKGAVSNAQVSLQSTFNKVMFGIEVAEHLLDMVPWATHWISAMSGRGWRWARLVVQDFRVRGQRVPGLLVHTGGGGRRVLKVDMVAQGVEQGAPVGIKPLLLHAGGGGRVGAWGEPALQMRRSVRVSSFVPRAWKVSAVPPQEAKVLLRGLEPNSKGIFRTPAGEYLIRPVDVQGRVQVYRIKADFRLYDPNGLTVQVVDSRSRAEVGVLLRGEHGQWLPVGARSGGPAGSTLSGLPDQEFLHSPAYVLREHQVATLPAFERSVYQAWFNRDKKRFFRHLVLPPRPAPLQIEPSMTVDTLIERVFKQSPGLVLGEHHKELASKAFLKEKMQLLRRQGVRTLYMEGLNAKELPYRRSRLRGDAQLTEVYEAAQTLGIKVRGLDDSLLTLHIRPSTGFGRVDLTKRLGEMNYFAVREIERHHPKDGGKWVAWVGAAHMNTAEGVPGIAELTGAIGVRIRDARPGRPAAIVIPVSRDYLPDGPLADVRIDFTPGMP